MRKLLLSAIIALPCLGFASTAQDEFIDDYHPERGYVQMKSKDERFDPNGYYPYLTREERMEAFPEASFKTIMYEIHQENYRWAEYHLYFLQGVSVQDEIMAKLLRLLIAVKKHDKPQIKYWKDSIEESIRESFEETE